MTGSTSNARALNLQSIQSLEPKQWSNKFKNTTESSLKTVANNNNINPFNNSIDALYEN